MREFHRLRNAGRGAWIVLAEGRAEQIGKRILALVLGT
jgi:hypothetical protein